MTRLFQVFAFLLVTAASSASASDVSPMTVDGAKTVSAADAKALFDGGALFVDVRSDKDWNAGRIPGALHLELKSAFSEQALAAEADKNEAIVIYCNGESCLRSSKASELAVGWGFTKIQYFREGYPAWKSANYPVE